MTYLLDVNLLLALTDPMHVHHELAHRWLYIKCQNLALSTLVFNPPGNI